MVPTTIRNCPICGGDDLHPGHANIYPDNFVPEVESWLTFAPALPLKLFACLTCGYVGHFLAETDLRTLRQKLGRETAE